MTVNVRSNSIMQPACSTAMIASRSSASRMPEVGRRGAGSCLTDGAVRLGFRSSGTRARVHRGHEIFGVVEQPGHAMHGRRSRSTIPLHCDRCAACKRGAPRWCLESPA